MCHAKNNVIVFIAHTRAEASFTEYRISANHSPAVAHFCVNIPQNGKKSLHCWCVGGTAEEPTLLSSGESKRNGVFKARMSALVD